MQVFEDKIIIMQHDLVCHVPYTHLLQYYSKKNNSSWTSDDQQEISDINQLVVE